ncbi:hypothetical protein Peur_008693 [Populus x canadensis]
MRRTTIKMGFSYWLWEFHRMGRLLDAADHKLNGEFAKDGLECLLLLGVACCHPNPHQRPSMRTVLQVLSGEAAPLVPPESPAIIWPALPSSSKESECSLSESQLASFSEIRGRSLPRSKHFATLYRKHQSHPFSLPFSHDKDDF